MILLPTAKAQEEFVQGVDSSWINVLDYGPAKELPGLAAPDMAFRVTDLAGRLLLEIEARAGSQIRPWMRPICRRDCIFLQIVSAGREEAVKKFVKQ